MMNNRYFVVEGIDGSGKSYFAEQLVQRLGEQAILVREPYDSLLYTSEIKQYITGDWERDAMMFQAMRQDIMERIVKPAFAEGKIVISDRSWISTLVYQVCSCGLLQRYKGGGLNGIPALIGRNASKMDLWYSFLSGSNPKPAYVFGLQASLEEYARQEHSVYKVPALLEKSYEELCARYRYIQEVYFPHNWTWYPQDMWKDQAYYNRVIDDCVSYIIRTR